MRTLLKRFTRLSLGFSKKLENLEAACAMYFAFYNYVLAQPAHGLQRQEREAAADSGDDGWADGSVVEF